MFGLPIKIWAKFVQHTIYAYKVRILERYNTYKYTYLGTTKCYFGTVLLKGGFPNRAELHFYLNLVQNV